MVSTCMPEGAHGRDHLLARLHEPHELVLVRPPRVLRVDGGRAERAEATREEQRGLRLERHVLGLGGRRERERKVNHLMREAIGEVIGEAIREVIREAIMEVIGEVIGEVISRN